MTTSQVSLRPIENKERIGSIDTIRGVALLGILLMNVIGFGLFQAYYDPTNSGGATGWNLNAWWINNMFIEGTMRGLFSMLFGAGIILFTSRSTNSLHGVSVTDAYFRRILWLFLFGVIHCYLLLWFGDILYSYSVVALFAFSFRNWQPKFLIVGTIVLATISTVLVTKDYVHVKKYSDRAVVASEKKSNGETLTKREDKDLKEWEDIVADRKASPEHIKEAVEEMNKGYFSILMFRAPLNQTMETTVMYRVFFWDVFAMVMLGMAFLKNGIFKAEKSNLYYIMLALIGYGVGLTVNYLETNFLMNHQFDVLSFYLTEITYELGRIPTTVGHIGLIMLFIKSGALPFLQKALAAVGQMAFTNYITQTIICNIIFMGFGFGQFNLLQRYELYYIVFSIWLFQLIISLIWLRYFLFGPLEWAWRSLSYWRFQPLRRSRRVLVALEKEGYAV